MLAERLRIATVLPVPRARVCALHSLPGALEPLAPLLGATWQGAHAATGATRPAAGIATRGGGP